MITYNGVKVKFRNKRFKMESDSSVDKFISSLINTLKKENEGINIDIKAITPTFYSHTTVYTTLSNVVDEYMNIYIVYSIDEQKEIF